MKNFKTLLLAATLFIGGISMANAQSKVAHIDTQDLTNTYPAYLAAKAEAQKIAETLTAADEITFNDMVANLEQTTIKFQKEAPTQTKAVNDDRVKQVEKMRASIAEFQQSSQQKIIEAQSKKMAPVGQKIKTAIDKVAKTLGFDYVIDKSALVVYNGKDITAEVKKELGY